MKDKRPGESLWAHWDGDLYLEELSDTDLVYYTSDHVYSSSDLVVRALASTLQRDGVVDSLGDGFRLLDNGFWNNGYSGYFEGDTQPIACDENGLTILGDLVDEVVQTTWVEVIKN